MLEGCPMSRFALAHLLDNHHIDKWVLEMSSLKLIHRKAKDVEGGGSFLFLHHLEASNSLAMNTTLIVCVQYIVYVKVLYGYVGLFICISLCTCLSVYRCICICTSAYMCAYVKTYSCVCICACM